jgi:tripartite-type tricarboxylate transporter receptor subunit TctC
MQRRQFLILTGAAALAACQATPPAGTEEPPLTIITPYAQGAFDALLGTIAAPLSRRLGRGVAIEVAPEDGGWEALNRLHAGDPASVVLADADLSLALKQEWGGRGFSLAQLRPLAKLTDGLSVALVARTDGPYSTWEGLREAAASQDLRLASTGPLSDYAVAERLMRTMLGDRFETVTETDAQAIFDALARGRAELGLVTTLLIERHNTANPAAGVVPLMTFGAQRAARYPQTPTLAELARDNKRDFTFALGLFGSPEFPVRMARALLVALREIEADPELAGALQESEVPLHVSDGETLHEAIERNLRLIRRLGPPA